MEENSLDIPTVENAGFDPTPFEGKQVKIADVRRDIIDSHYVDGEWDPNKTTKQHVVIVETEPVTTIQLGDGTQQEIRVNQRFSLQERVNPETKEREVVISKNPRAKLWAFMRKMGVSRLEDLKQKIVTLTVEPSRSPDDDRKFLRIVS